MFTVRRQQFVPFGTVKSVINAAKAGFPPDKEIEVRHASQPKTAATGAVVRRRLQLHSCHVVESSNHAAQYLMYLQVKATAKACESTDAKQAASTDSIMKKSRSHAQSGCAVACGRCGVGDYASWVAMSTT